VFMEREGGERAVQVVSIYVSRQATASSSVQKEVCSLFASRQELEVFMAIVRVVYQST